MAGELIVKMTDETTGRPIKVDINGGYVYDEGGNQIARWGVKDSSADADIMAMCADYVSEEAKRLMGCALTSPVHAQNNFDAPHMMSGRHLMSGLSPSEVHQNAALPNYAAGYRNFAPIADACSPPLLVGKMSDKYYTFAKEDAFQLVMPVPGAAGAEVGEVSPRIGNDTFTTVMDAIGAFTSTDIEGAADAPLRIRQAAAKRALNGLMMNRERRVSTLLGTSGSWDSTTTVALAAAAKWNGGASANPIYDIQTRIEKSWGPCTALVMNERVFHDFQRAEQVQKYFTYKDNAPALPTPQQISAILQLPPIYVGRMKYVNTSGALDYIWPDDAILLCQPETMPPMDQESVATSYTFRWNLNGIKVDGQIGAGGFLVREFFQPQRGGLGGNKVVVVLQETSVMTSAFVGGRIGGAHQ